MTPARPLSARLRRTVNSDGFVALLMMAPAAVLFGIFFVWPFVSGFWLSLHRWDGFSAPVFNSGGNYLRLLRDPLFLKALGNNLIFVAAVLVLKNVLGLGLAMLLDRAVYARAFIRAAVFVPVTLSFVATGLLWSWIYNPVFGLLNAFLDLVGLSALKVSWLGDADVALYSVITVDVWKWLGFHAVIYLAGLQTLPHELYDAAKMDGANALQRFIRITLPLMLPVIFINTILGLSGAFVRNFDIVYVLTQGGPNHATEVVMTLMMKAAFQDGAMGYASAMGYALFLIVGLFSVALLALMRRTRFEI
jgi:raffinose/stachyose/melibiose transport system permease protein